LLDLAIADDVAPPKYVPRLLASARTNHSEAAAKAISVFSSHMPASEVVNTGRLMLGLTRSSGMCFYFAGFVRAVPTIAGPYERQLPGSRVGGSVG
jgi:hypothetical protein